MNTSKLILSFSCGKVNFSRSILLLKRGFYMSEEMEVACLLWLSDDKSPAETFWVVCQMTNRSQRRFEPFVRWQIARRDVLSRLSDDKSFPETFWAICQMTNRPQRRFGMGDPSTSRKMTIWARLYSGVFAWKGIFMDCHASLAMTGVRSLDCHADARNDGCEVTGLPRWRSQWRVWGHWIATLTLAIMSLVHEFTKVFSRARG